MMTTVTATFLYAQDTARSPQAGVEDPLSSILAMSRLARLSPIQRNPQQPKLFSKHVL